MGAPKRVIGEVGEYTFYAGDALGTGETCYTFTINGERKVWEWYPTIDKMLLAAVCEKYTGHRGADGDGVGTAADWVARMIGLEK